MKNIVIASDSFKGSLTSAEVAAAARNGIRKVFPDCRITEICMADGGEGTTDALFRTLGGRTVECAVHDPLMREMTASYVLAPDGTAIMEMSAASGLPLLGANERNPLSASTFGTGEMIADALRRGCRNFLIGIGGSATNDAGTGMLSALGFRWLDKDGDTLDGTGENLARIADADTSGVMPELREAGFTIACDVDNPFCGPDGAAFIFAPQKGASPETVRILDSGMQSFAGVTRRITGCDMTGIKGAGAAGGLGGAFTAYLGGRLRSGAEMILDAVGFDKAVSAADLAITGEGRIDSQTSMGKVPYAVLKRASAHGVPVIAIAGSVAEDIGEKHGFAAILPVVPRPMSLEEAMRHDTAAANITRTVANIMKLLSAIK